MWSSKNDILVAARTVPTVLSVRCLGAVFLKIVPTSNLFIVNIST